MRGVASTCGGAHVRFVVMFLVCLLHMYIVFGACLTNVCHVLNVFEKLL